MSSDSKLDQLVKGQPPPNVSPNQIAQEAKHQVHHEQQQPSSSITAPAAAAPPPPVHPHDPRDALPSSPPQIYLNLLILESSLRLQYLSLRARLRLHLLLLAFLTVWVLTFTYLLFFRPREDGSGVGGSVYWVVETGERLGWGGGVVTLILFYATGMYDRGVRWPRKFVGTTNRGMRQFSLKVVVVRGSFLQELSGWVGFMLAPWRWTGQEGKRVSFQLVPKDIESAGEGAKGHWNAHASRHGLIDEDVAPGGDVLKVLLLPKPFSPDFREGWENYRAEFWTRENERRGELRKVIKARQREVARKDGGWLWWTGWRGWGNVHLLGSGKSRRQKELEKLALREKPSGDRLREKDRLLRRRGEDLLRSDSTHSHSRSRASSRASNTGSVGAGEGDGSAAPAKAGSRRGSSNAGTLRRPRKAGTATQGHGSRLSATETILQHADEHGSIIVSGLRREDLQMSSTTSSGSGGSSSRKTTPGSTPEIKQESEEA